MVSIGFKGDWVMGWSVMGGSDIHVVGKSEGLLAVC